MTRQQFLQELCEVIDTEVPLTGVETLKDLKWDSLAAVSFIALADEACGVNVAPRDIAGCNTVDDLVALVSAAFEGVADPGRP